MIRNRPLSRKMPVLEHLKSVFQTEFGSDFSKLPNRENTLFVLIQHGFASIRPMMEMLLGLGISADQVFMTTKPHTTPTEDMLPYFTETFEHYVPFQWSVPQSVLDQPDIIEAGKGSRYKTLTAVTHKKLFDHFCDYLLRYQEGSNRKIENIIICDEGGKFLSQFIERYHQPDPRARRNLNDYHIVAIEHTKCGTYRPELRNLPFPLINMADSYIKTKVEAKYIAESMFVYLNAVLERIKNAASMAIGVVGGGNIGKEVLVFLSQQYSDTHVIVFDLDHSMMTATDINQQGWQNVTRVASADIIFQQANVILGCTGKNFMKGVSQYCFSENPENHVHLISCSSGDSEFQVWLERMPDYQFESLNDIRDYTLTVSSAKQVTLYNGGFPMNFYVQQPDGIPAPETVPLDKVQITRSMKLAAIVQALKLLEVTPYISKQDDASLKDYMRLDILYQWEIIQSFYHELNEENIHEKVVVEEQSIGVNQPTMNTVLKIPHYMTTQHQIIMQKQLAVQQAPIKILVIHGTTGSGKTTLAQHYLQKQRIQMPTHLSHVLLAETKEQWLFSLRNWAEELSPELSDLLKTEKDPKQQERLIMRLLQKSLRKQFWCIVIDNWDQNALQIIELEKLFLNADADVGKGTLLITTQGQSPYGKTQSLDLSQGFAPDESKGLLIKVMKLKEELGITWESLGSEAELQTLTALLNHLPLAVVLAGSYLLWENKARCSARQPLFTYVDYQQMLKQHVAELIRIHDEQLGTKGNVPREEREEFIRIKTQEAAVDLSLKKAIQLDSTDPNMNLWQMLCFCGFLASDGIPQQLLKDYLQKLNPDKKEAQLNREFSNILRAAQHYSLLQFENTSAAIDGFFTLHMHKVIQRVLRDKYWFRLFEIESYITWFISWSTGGISNERKLLQLMRNSLLLHFSIALDKGLFNIVKEYLPHIEAWNIHELERVSIDLRLDNIYLQDGWARASSLLGNYAKAEALYRSMVLLLENHTTEDTLASMQQNLATTLEKLGRFSEAEALHRQVLTTLIKYHGTQKHVNVASAQESLGNALLGLGRASEAEKLLRQALATTIEHNGTTECENVAINQINLGNALDILGQFSEAEILHRQALAVLISCWREIQNGV